MRIQTGMTQVYAGPLAGNARVALLFNRHDNTDKKFNTANMTVYWKLIGLPEKSSVRLVNACFFEGLLERAAPLPEDIQHCRHVAF